MAHSRPFFSLSQIKRCHGGEELRLLSLEIGGMISPPIIFYRPQVCPFCERVVRPLKELDLDGMSGIAELRAATSLIDSDGIINHAWVAGAWPKFPDYKAIEAAIEEL